MPDLLDRLLASASSLPIIGRAAQRWEDHRADNATIKSVQADFDRADQSSGMSAWDATTGTFAVPAIDAVEFSQMIRDHLAEFGHDDDLKTGMLSTLNNAAVYLHGAGTANRPAPTIEGIAEEWASLGISVREATEMLDKTVTHHLGHEQIGNNLDANLEWQDRQGEWEPDFQPQAHNYPDHETEELQDQIHRYEDEMEL